LFKEQQKIWVHDDETGKILTGKISDKYCNIKYKFNRKPLSQRTEIPILWDNGTFGVVHFKEVKVII